MNCNTTIWLAKDGNKLTKPTTELFRYFWSRPHDRKFLYGIVTTTTWQQHKVQLITSWHVWVSDSKLPVSASSNWCTAQTPAFTCPHLDWNVKTHLTHNWHTTQWTFQFSPKLFCIFTETLSFSHQGYSDNRLLQVFHRETKRCDVYCTNVLKLWAPSEWEVGCHMTDDMVKHIVRGAVELSSKREVQPDSYWAKLFKMVHLLLRSALWHGRFQLHNYILPLQSLCFSY